MAVHYRQRTRSVAAAVLLLCAAALLARPARGVAPAPGAQRDGSSLETAQRISDLPGCGEDASLQPAMDTCTIHTTLSGAGATRWFTFAITQDTSLEMTVTIVARTTAGAVDIMLWYPGESPGSSRADQFGTNAGYNLSSPNAQNPPASDIDYVYLAGRDMVTPGVYTLMVAAKSGTPSVQLQVATASALTRMAEDELQSLARLLESCCPLWGAITGGGGGAEIDRAGGWCGAVGKAMVDPKREYTSDPCHVPPNLCTTDGYLTQLILPAGGLDCKGRFPKELAAFKRLRSVELSYNLLGATPGDAGAVVAQMPALESLILRGTGLHGPLTCDLVGDKAHGMRKSLVLSNNPAVTGTLDSCLTTSQALEELQLDGTSIEGTLPGLAPGAPLRFLYLGAAPGAGKLTGTIPASYGAASALRHLQLAGHGLSGPLPRLPPGLQLLDAAHNALSGPFPDLSHAPGLDYLDVSHNRLGGSLPRNLAADNPALDYLDASGNAIGGRLDELTLPGSLAFADLSSNAIGGGLWGSSAGWGNLVELRLARNAITGPLKASLASSPALRRLDVSGNQLSGDLSAFASALERSSSNGLVALNVSHNNLVGPVPPGLSRLAVFDPLPIKTYDGLVQERLLDLSGNRLTGAFPSFAAQAIPPMEAGCRCAYSVELGDSPLACPSSLPSPMNQAANVLKARAPDMTCEGRDSHGNTQRVPVWTLVTRGDAPAAGPASHPAPNSR
ncbi:MAG: hypothetical protein J3K34DRAFT_459560, partial [Monoraphidium minutum]